MHWKRVIALALAVTFAGQVAFPVLMPSGAAVEAASAVTNLAVSFVSIGADLLGSKLEGVAAIIEANAGALEPASAIALVSSAIRTTPAVRPVERGWFASENLAIPGG